MDISAALDISTHMSTSYLDIRLRFHLAACGIYEKHNAADIFDTASKALDVIGPPWRDTIIGVSTDGERKMTGHISGVAIRFKNVVKPGFIRIWSGAHQLGIVLQCAYSKLGENLFYCQLTALISYLPRPQNHIFAVRSKAPKVADTRWESMGKVSEWFKKNKIEIDLHINEKRPNCKPSKDRWIDLMAVADFSDSATSTFKCLQGHQVNVSMQRTHLASQQTSMLRAVGGGDPLSESEAATLDGSEWVLSDCRRFAASLLEAKQLIMILGSCVINKLASVEAGDLDQIVKNVASLYVNSASGVGGIVVERNQANKSDEAVLPVIPHQLAQQSHSDFCGDVRNHRERLLAAGWTSTSLDAVEQEHQALRRAFNAEPSLHALLSPCKDDVPFDDGWSAVKVVSNPFMLSLAALLLFSQHRLK